MKFITRKESMILVEKFCNQNNYPLDMVYRLNFSSGYPDSSYSIPSSTPPTSFWDDLATQPTPILFIALVDGEYKVIETEYTKPYFRGDLDHLFKTT